MILAFVHHWCLPSTARRSAYSQTSQTDAPRYWPWSAQGHLYARTGWWTTFEYRGTPFPVAPAVAAWGRRTAWQPCPKYVEVPETKGSSYNLIISDTYMFFLGSVSLCLSGMSITQRHTMYARIRNVYVQFDHDVGTTERGLINWGR
jgi:hypothetical protein